MLKNYTKLIYESRKDGKPFCLVAAVIAEGKLQIQRVDFEEWERNRRNGQVELYYFFDENNTTRLAESFGVSSSGRLISEIKRRFADGNFSLNFFSNLRNFCESNNIHYDYRVWY